MVNCWARELGDCCDVQSKEHYVTKGLFKSKGLRVRGLPWCRHETKRIGLGSAASNILCRDHNSRLSTLDAEAIQAFEALREIFELRHRQAQLPSRLWKKRVWTVDARLLERWFLKTFINLGQIQQPAEQWRGTSAGQPPLDAVRAVFGLDPIKSPFGLHAAAGVGQKVTSDQDVLAFVPLRRATDHMLVAGAFEFRGFRFVLKWTEEDLSPFFRTAGFRDPAFVGWDGSDLIQPFRTLRFASGLRTAQELRFKWPQFRPPQVG